MVAKFAFFNQIFCQQISRKNFHSRKFRGKGIGEIAHLPSGQDAIDPRQAIRLRQITICPAKRWRRAAQCINNRTTISRTCYLTSSEWHGLLPVPHRAWSDEAKTFLSIDVFGILKSARLLLRFLPQDTRRLRLCALIFFLNLRHLVMTRSTRFTIRLISGHPDQYYQSQVVPW